MNTFAIGVDLGATKIKTGAVDTKGNVFDRVAADTKASKGPTTVINQILYTISVLCSRCNQSECMGIGIGAPGVVSLDGNVVSHPPNFSDWTEVDLKDAISKVHSLPISVDNDANVAALAEAKYGAGVNQKDFLFVIWGTGVGGGIILDRKIFHGPSGGAGEIGHISIDYNGPLCNCGNRGCIESYIGQRYLSQRTREILEAMKINGRTSNIEQLVNGNLDKIEPSIISQAAEQGDQSAIGILQEAGELLGYALASVFNVLDLNVAVIGGGISAAPQFVFQAIESSTRSRVLKPHQNHIQVLRANLGNNAGIIGAASLVM
ncbi:MAG: ROK family protein [Ignavibacteriae bacterium]|nr:ROK family protein [Ignavibacteriota bacterium]